MEATTDPLSSIREEIERVAHEAPGDPAQAAITLARTRDLLVDLLGRCDTYAQAVAKLQEAEASVSAAEVARAYEVADVREELVERAIATPQELEEAGIPTRAELDALREEGLLYEAVARMKERWGEVEESVFNPYLHPRDRVGRFRDNASPQLRKLDEPSLEDIFGDLLAAPPPELDLTKHPLPPVKLSPEVKKINTTKDAEAYFKAMGIQARLDGLDNADGLRQIAQAVTDTRERFPSLKGGRQGKLAGIMSWSSGFDKDPGDARMFRSGSVWAETGPDASKGSSLTGAYDISPGMKPRAEGWMALEPDGGGGPDTWIVVNDTYREGNGRWFDDTPTAGRSAALADRTVYGRMMHELGHAVTQTNGTTFEEGGQRIPNMMEKAGVTPESMSTVSSYGASSPFEAWAEVFATLNVPGALDAYPPETRTLLTGLQTLANEQGERRHSGRTL